MPPEPALSRSRRRSRGGERAHRPETEAGFVAVEWVAAVVFLLLPVVLIGAGASRWPERQEAARAAAAEGARAAVLADTYAGAVANATLIAGEVATNRGVPAGEFSVQVDTPAWDWGQPVTVTVTVGMPTLDIPGIGSWSATSWSVSSTQRIEDYRGLE